MRNRRKSSGSPQNGLMQIGSQFALLVTAAVTIFLVVLVLDQSWHVAPASAPRPTVLSSPSTIPSATSPAASPTPTVVAFLGDTYTAGGGATEPANRWTTLVSLQLHLTERNFGGSESGYGTAGPDGSAAFVDQLTEIAATNPDAVVIAGGAFDFLGSSTTDEVSSAITRTFADLRARLPNTQLIAISPIWPSLDIPPRLSEIGSQIEAAVSSAGGSYISTDQRWAADPSRLSAEKLPNDSGHAALAEAIGTALGPTLGP